jgi:hypothetical protein
MPFTAMYSDNYHDFGSLLRMSPRRPSDFWVSFHWDIPIFEHGSKSESGIWNQWYCLMSILYFFTFRLFRRDFPNRRARSYTLYRIDHSNSPAVTKYSRYHSSCFVYLLARHVVHSFASVQSSLQISIVRNFFSPSPRCSFSRVPGEVFNPSQQV